MNAHVLLSVPFQSRPGIPSQIHPRNEPAPSAPLLGPRVNGAARCLFDLQAVPAQATDQAKSLMWTMLSLWQALDGTPCACPHLPRSMWSARVGIWLHH